MLKIIENIIFSANFINVLSIVVTISSIIATVYFYNKSKKLEREKIKLNWSDLKLIIDNLTESMIKTGFKPDIILAPGLRGAIISEILIDKYNREIPVFVGVSRIHSPNSLELVIDNFKKIEVRKNWNIYIPEVFFKYYDKKVLIVDDFCLTGSFFYDLKQNLQEKGFNSSNIKVLCSVITNATELSDNCPDYYWKAIPDDNFYFPWGRANRG